jgi:hypothetical protein
VDRVSLKEGGREKVPVFTYTVKPEVFSQEGFYNDVVMR